MKSPKYILVHAKDLARSPGDATGNSAMVVYRSVALEIREGTWRKVP